MFFLVSLKETQQKVLVPQKWILNLNLEIETLLNLGVKFIKNKVFKIYISNIYGDEPDFHLQIMGILDKKRAACYEAFIIKTFGKI